MAPHSCKGCLRDIIAAKMSKDNENTPMEVNGIEENGLPDNPCKNFICIYSPCM